MNSFRNRNRDKLAQDQRKESVDKWIAAFALVALLLFLAAGIVLKLAGPD